MFSSLVTRLHSEIQTVKDLLGIHDRARDLFYRELERRDGPADDASKSADMWAEVRTPGLKRLDWLVHDHCAGLTRLYALYENFVEDLASEYIRTLPGLYASYQELPNPVLKQHRTGFGQVLLKLSDTGPYRHLSETNIDARLFRSNPEDEPYSLLKEAFFVDRQNYRAEALARLYGYLGIANLKSRIGKHPRLVEFLSSTRPGITFEGELNRFVQLRNEAAHSAVEDAVASDEIKWFGDLLLIICEVLEEVVSVELIQRKMALGQLIEIGTLEQTYHKGRVLIARMRPLPVALGDTIVIRHGGTLQAAKLESIQSNDVNLDNITPGEGQMLGFGLDRRIRFHGMLPIYKLPAPPVTPELFEQEEKEAEISIISQEEPSSEDEAEPDEPKETGS